MKKKNKKIFLFLNFLFIILVIATSFYFLNQNKEIHNKKISEIQKNNPTIKDEEIKISLFKNYYNQAVKIVSKMTLEEKVGQLFLVRYDKENIENFTNLYPGGYILFAKDFENHTKETIKEELETLQNKNKYPLVIGVDEEGGFVTRISRFSAFRSEKFKSPRAYLEEGGLDLLEKTEKEKAKLLKELGINLNLAPVADVSVNENDFINNRTFGKDAKETSLLIEQMVKFANEEKISSCLKHFPGYGNNVDTHTGIAIDNRSYKELKENDFLPFKAGIRAKVPTILVSHNIITSIDSNLPASLSKNVLKELRETLKFSGIIMTDDLAMEAVKSYVEAKKSVTLALNAGNDLIITSDFPTMYQEALTAARNKEVSEETINKAVLRIIAWKYSNNLFL